MTRSKIAERNVIHVRNGLELAARSFTQHFVKSRPYHNALREMRMVGLKREADKLELHRMEIEEAIRNFQVEFDRTVALVANTYQRLSK